MSEDAAEGRSFAEKFARLIEAMHPSDREPYSDREIAEALGMSRQYIWQLRTGQRGEPRGSTVREITGFFGVPDDYFVDDAVTDMVDAEVATVRRAAGGVAVEPGDEVEARRLAQRYLALTREGRQAVSSLIDALDSYDRPKSERASS